MRGKTVQHVFFFTLLALTTLAFLGLIQDFLQPLFWAAVLATLFHPMQERWTQVLGGRPALAAVFTMLTIIVIVILPLFLVGVAVARESVALVERVAAGEIDLQAPIRFLERIAPVVTDYMDRYGVDPQQITENLSSTAVVASQFLATSALAIGQNALHFTVLLFLMLYILFFFLRDGERFVELIMRALPLGDVRERRLLAKFAEVARATIKGTLVVGVVQGALGGFFFWALGLPAPVFWAVVMALFSFLPAVGAAIVWVPAAAILLATGEILKGLVLVAAGTLVISLADNLLRPVLVGRDTQMPDFLILLSTLGGLAAFGLSGVVIGPIIAAFFLVVWEMFTEEYADAIEEDPDPEPVEGAL